MCSCRPPPQRGRRPFCAIKGVSTGVASAQYVHFRQNWKLTSPFKQGRELVPLPCGSGEDSRSALLTSSFRKFWVQALLCVTETETGRWRQKTDRERQRRMGGERERTRKREEEEDVQMG